MDGAILARNELQYGLFAVKTFCGVRNRWKLFWSVQYVVDYIWKIYSLQYRTGSIQLVHPDSPFMMYPFYSSNTLREASKVYLPLKPKDFPSCLVAFYIVSKHVLVLITRKSGLAGGTVALFIRFLGVLLFGAKIGACTRFWRAPLLFVCRSLDVFFPSFLYFSDKIDVFWFRVGRALSLYDLIPGCFPFLACSYISVIFTKYVEYEVSGNIPSGSSVFIP